MAYTAEHLTSRSERRMVDYDIDGSANLVVLDPATGAVCLPAAEFRRFIVGVFRSVGTGGITTVKIVAATSADGANATAVVTLTPTTADAVGDTVWAETNVEQLREALAGATHVGVEIDLVTATDECVVFFERAEPQFPRAGLTANYIS